MTVEFSLYLYLYLLSSFRSFSGPSGSRKKLTPCPQPWKLLILWLDGFSSQVELGAVCLLLLCLRLVPNRSFGLLKVGLATGGAPV